jgi:hypothetical protein
MTDDPHTDLPEPRNLRALRVLVTVLMWVMIVGITTVVGLLAMRIAAPGTPPLPALPDQIVLPEGVTPLAVTAAPGWYAVVTQDNRILIYDAQSGALQQDVTITSP